MNHDELLERVSEYISSECDCESCNFINGPYKALRAVVELHKPHNKYKGVCSGCYEEESGFSDYPCATIQAIEAELNQ